MSQHGFRGGWRALQGRLKESWSEHMRDEMGKIEGVVEQISGILERAYDIAPELARPHAEECAWNAQLATWSEQLVSDWDASQRRIAKQWGKLSDADIQAVDGQAARLLASIQKGYGTEDWQAASEMLSFFRDWREAAT